MKILHITEKPRFSGAEILIRDLTLSHIDQATVAIASFNPTEDDFKDTMHSLEIKGVHLFIPNYSLSKLERFTHFFKVFKEFQPDVVVGHSSIVSVYMRMVGILFPKIKKVVVLHSGSGDYESPGRIKNVEYVLQYFTDYVIGVSDWSRNLYRNKFRGTECKTIFNGINLEKFSSQHKKYRDITRKDIFGVNNNRFVILQVGRISRVKNQLLSVQAISMLEDDIKKNLLIVFAGIIEDKEYYQEILEFCDENHLTEKVQFLGARSDVNKLLYAADLYVMPSEREAFGIALLEALSVGIPTIYSGISQFDFLNKYDFKHIYKIDLKNMENYIETISTIIKEKIPFTQRNLDDFSFAKCSEQYMKLFKEIV